MTNLLDQEANLRNNEAQLILAKYEESLANANITLIIGNPFIQSSIIKKGTK